MKKGFLVMIALTLLLAIGFPQEADARRGGGFKSPKQSFTQTPKKSDNVSKTTTDSKTGGATAGTAAKTGGFLGGGGGLMKGMMLGGLAGLMFGSMFGNMGAMGQFLGLMVNLLAIFAVIMLIRVAFVYLRSKKDQRPDQRRPY
ncbi:hypothetical protein A7K91_03905 [Paenibacillus oryzae]|jgi:predicted lipid-binding transport protein (Tim44 family)|uniref:Preprotein translocase subunit Tim44 n=1 Tax=Paenibacillus oryzae TaxID=1844972 RepID=A0A1A5YGM6_9BACL|nr:hypothetical protein [Paenibacillus oryzae]OBR64737.1 hypothetical protein A7K91_03905 [Paenibacillus oryzae]